jgi:hypothetical protein
MTNPVSNHDMKVGSNTDKRQTDRDSYKKHKEETHNKEREKRQLKERNKEDELKGRGKGLRQKYEKEKNYCNK